MLKQWAIQLIATKLKVFGLSVHMKILSFHWHENNVSLFEVFAFNIVCIASWCFFVFLDILLLHILEDCGA